MTAEQKRADNVKRAIEAIESFGDEGVTVKDISELVGISTQTVYNMQSDLELNDIECRATKNGRRFFYKPNMKEVYKNSEGYTDRTAGDVISGKKAMSDFKIGGVYEEKYLILKSFSDTLVYLDISKMSEKGKYCNDICVRFDLNGEEVFVNPHRIWTVMRKDVNVNELRTIDMGLFRQISGLAGMNVVEVEKEVEKVVYRDRIVEKEVADVEYKLLEQRAEIWEKAFYAVTGKGA